MKGILLEYLIGVVYTALLEHNLISVPIVGKWGVKFPQAHNLKRFIMGVTRFPNGISTAAPNSTLHNMGAPDPTRFHSWLEDFDRYISTEWTVTEVGTATQVIIDGDGGLLEIVNSAGATDSAFLAWDGGASAALENFKFEAGKKLFFKARFKVSDATQSDFVIGLQKKDTTPLDVTDGVFFQKDDGDALLDFYVEKDNVPTIATGIATVEDDTFLTIGFEYNGVDFVDYYVNDAKQGSSIVENLPDDEELSISFGIQNGEAVAKSMIVDYIFVAKER